MFGGNRCWRCSSWEHYCSSWKDVAANPHTYTGSFQEAHGESSCESWSRLPSVLSGVVGMVVRFEWVGLPVQKSSTVNPRLAVMYESGIRWISTFRSIPTHRHMSSPINSVVGVITFHRYQAHSPERLCWRVRHYDMSSRRGEQMHE